MDGIKVNDVAAILTSVAAYGGQLAAVFHNYALTAVSIPYGFEGTVHILDATVATLRQILAPLKDEAGPSGKNIFSEDGLKYVQLLAEHCATSLSKFEPVIEEACLEHQERASLLKRRKKVSAVKFISVPNPLSLRLNEKEFLEKVENMQWSCAIKEIEKCTERLYEVQLHVLLVFQVVTVCALSRDVYVNKPTSKICY